ARLPVVLRLRRRRRRGRSGQRPVQPPVRDVRSGRERYEAGGVRPPCEPTPDRDGTNSAPTGAPEPTRSVSRTVRKTEAHVRVIINGVGVAGPTLAFWLRRAGHEPLLVEAAPRL